MWLTRNGFIIPFKLVVTSNGVDRNVPNRCASDNIRGALEIELHAGSIRDSREEHRERRVVERLQLLVLKRQFEVHDVACGDSTDRIDGR